MLHAFLFNIRNYSPEVINIQRREAELNIILPRVHNFDIKQKRHGIFMFYFMPPTPNKIWGNKGNENTAKFGYNTSFFRKN